MFKKIHDYIVSVSRKAIKPFLGHGLSALPFAIPLYRFFLSSLNISHDIFQIQGSKMFLDKTDSLGVFGKDVYEPLLTSLFKEKIKKGDVVLDIGAHIGYYALLFSRLVGDSGKVYAFEPDPANFALLQKNVEVNGYTNIVLVNKAVSDKNGKVKLYVAKDSTGIHRIYDTHDGRGFVEVESVRLDDYFKDYGGKIDWIKIDIEGAEWLAFQGMISLLGKNEKLNIVTEFAPHFIKSLGIEPGEYLKLLQKNSSHIYDFNEDNDRLEEADVEELLKTYAPEKKKTTNILFLK